MWRTVVPLAAPPQLERAEAPCAGACRCGRAEAMIIPTRPAGLSDDDIRKEFVAAIAKGMLAVAAQARAWGVSRNP